MRRDLSPEVEARDELVRLCRRRYVQPNAVVSAALRYTRLHLGVESLRRQAQYAAELAALQERLTAAVVSHADTLTALVRLRAQLEPSEQP